MAGPEPRGPTRARPIRAQEAHKGPGGLTDKESMQNPLNRVTFPEHGLNGRWPYIYIYIYVHIY